MNWPIVYCTFILSFTTSVSTYLLISRLFLQNKERLRWHIKSNDESKPRADYKNIHIEEHEFNQKKTKEKENLSFLSSNYQVSKYTSFLSDYVLMCDEWIWEGIHDCRETAESYGLILFPLIIWLHCSILMFYWWCWWQK